MTGHGIKEIDKVAMYFNSKRFKIDNRNKIEMLSIKNLMDFPINIQRDTLNASTLNTPKARAKISPPSGSHVKKAATLPIYQFFL